MQVDDLDVAALIAADNARYDALMASDLVALDRILTNDFTYTHNTGFTEDKAAYLGRIRDGDVYYSHGRRVRENTRIHGDTGIMDGHMLMRANLADRCVQLDNIFLAVWVREAGGWRLAAWASTSRDSGAE